MYNTRIPTIKNWATQDRPREKFIFESAMNLSNAELIAILIGSGNKDESAVHLAHRILESIDEDIQKLADLSVGDLACFKGIGPAKAVAIAAAVELGYRRMRDKNTMDLDTEASSVAYSFIKQELDAMDKDSRWIFLFSSSGLLLHKYQNLSSVGCFEEPLSVLQKALEYESKSLMLVHYSRLKYSSPDSEEKAYVLSLIEAAEMLSIRILDHMVLHSDGYFSYRDCGILPGS